MPSYSVLIEGTITPAAGVLARGDRQWVAMTPRIARLVAGGYVKLIEIRQELEATFEPASISSKPQDVDEDIEPTPEQSVLQHADAPAGNASTEEWLVFLRGKNIDVPVNEKGETPGRQGLKAIWQQVSGGS